MTWVFGGQGFSGDIYFSTIRIRDFYTKYGNTSRRENTISQLYTWQFYYPAIIVKKI